MICKECIMDDSDHDLTFDEKGVCSYCNEFKQNPEALGKYSPEIGLTMWTKKVEEIKEHGKGKKYDCLIGFSGGIDSSYLCYIAKEYLLKPLLLHVKNEFDSEVSKNNIQRTISHTGFDYKECALDFEEFKSLQLAFLRASVIDADVPTDYAIEAFNRTTARKNRIKYILCGGNFFADAFMPKHWTYSNKNDYAHIVSVHKRFGNDIKLGTVPKYGAWQIIRDKYMKRIEFLSPLNCVGYDRFKALKILQNKWGYEAYGDKHGENILSRFYQQHILPMKFGVDKRKANYSNYVRSGGMTRDEALAKLEEPLYSQEKFADDKNSVLTKLGLSNTQFDRLMSLPIRSHSEFRSDTWIYSLERKVRCSSKRVMRNLFGKRLSEKIVRRKIKW